MPHAWAETGIEGDLHALIDDYYYAIGENRMNQALNLYHKDSPETRKATQALLFGRSSYLQRTRTLKFDLVHSSGKHRLARVAHRHLRIVGVKFMESFTTAEYEFRQQGDEWKIWSSKEQRVRR
ncbi:MAG: hypothetical protein ACR2PZ_21855 [Pseudomonadales bacterium]